MPLDRTLTSTFAAYPKPISCVPPVGTQSRSHRPGQQNAGARRGSSYRRKLRSGTIRNEDSSSKLRRTKVSFRGFSAGP